MMINFGSFTTPKMNLIDVNKILYISITDEKLGVYIQALDNVLTEDITETDDIAILRKFSVELARILYDSRDY